MAAVSTIPGNDPCVTADGIHRRDVARLSAVSTFSAGGNACNEVTGPDKQTATSHKASVTSYYTVKHRSYRAH